MTKNRVSKGQPTGGEFAALNRVESSVALMERAQPGEYVEQNSSNKFCTNTSEAINVETGLTDEEFNTVTNHYLIAALWTGVDDDDEPLDSRYSVINISAEARATTAADLAKFMAENKETLDAARNTDYGTRSDGALEQIGHDFLLTRNGHGAGFWDRPELTANDLGKKLSDAARQYGDADFYVGDDGQVHL